jgi:NADPH:quinone reductase-like Zn-dependent oxidoreductase
MQSHSAGKKPALQNPRIFRGIEMKSVVYEKYGSPDVLELLEVEKPTPKEVEVLVKVSATTVIAGDSRMRSFTVPLSFWLPARVMLGVRKPKRSILGMEMAGEVESVGKDVKRFKVGDNIFASTIEHRISAYAEYICLPEDGMLATRSPDLIAEQATAIPIGGRTALYFLREADIQPGDKVLIYGASGSVGTFAVQLAKHFGAEVTGVCSSANLELVKSLGADKVIDYTKDDFTRNGETYDVIFDTVGKSTYSDSVLSLKEDGTFLHAVSAPGIDMRMRWTSMTSDKKTVGGGPPQEAEDLVFLAELVEAGVIKPVIDKCYPLDQIVDAHRYVDTGRKRGNVVIHMNNSHKS